MQTQRHITAMLNVLSPADAGLHAAW